MARHRLLLLLLLGWPFLRPGLARAAILDRINQAKDRIIIQLTKEELADLEEGQRVVVEVSAKTRFVVPATVGKINVVKKTAVLVFAQPDDRFQRRQQVRFLSAFWNPSIEPLIHDYSQYHQYARSAVEAALGFFYDGDQQKRSDEKITDATTGYRMLANAYILALPGWFGGGFGYEHRAATLKETGPSNYTADVTIDLIKPGLWVDLDKGWRLGLGYEFSLIDVNNHGDAFGDFNYTLGRPQIGLTHYGDDYEWGLSYIDKDHSTSTIVVEQGSTEVSVGSTLKVPGELSAWYRSVSSPVLIWGLGAGWIFYERNLEDGSPLQPAATPMQKLRLSASLETRLDDGAKLDWILAYDGGMTQTLTMSEQIANEGDLTVYYETTAFDIFTVGWSAKLGGGAITLQDQKYDANNNVVELDRKVVAYQASVLAFARWDFDLTPRPGRR